MKSTLVYIIHNFTKFHEDLYISVFTLHTVKLFEYRFYNRTQNVILINESYKT